MRIVLFCILAAVGYGILHDLVTAHVCIEYFTVAHMVIVPFQDVPLVAALTFGVLATWWVGLLLGIPLALAAQWGSRPKRRLVDVRPAVLALLRRMAVCALLAGCLGFSISALGWIWLVPPFSQRIPAHHWNAFFFAAFAHNTSYLVGLVGGLGVIARTWRGRSQ